MTDPIPDEAVEAAYRAYCEARKGKPLAPGEYEATYSRVEVAWLTTALTAAAPHIAAQATSDLRAGIEALRDDWLSDESNCARTPEGDAESRTLTECADALDALLRGAK